MHSESNVSIAQVGYDELNKKKKLSLIETIFFVFLKCQTLF